MNDDSILNENKVGNNEKHFFIQNKIQLFNADKGKYSSLKNSKNDKSLLHSTFSSQQARWQFLKRKHLQKLKNSSSKENFANIKYKILSKNN